MKIKDIYNPEKWLKNEKKEKQHIWLQNKMYKLKIRKKDSKEYISLELSTTSLIIKRILSSLIYLMVIIFISYIIDKIFVVFGWKDFILDFIRYDKDIFINFLISCVSIAGFLIALFYANLSGIFTSRYACLSSRISKELLNEHVNKKYVKSIQNYIIIILFILLLNIIGFQTDIILATIIVLLTVRIIIIFIELSKRIFIYSDTIIIGKNTMNKIIDIFDKVIVGSYQYDNVSFQNYHNQSVNENLKSLDDLAQSLIKDNDFDGLNTLLEINLNLIAKYSKLKNKIPFNSLWFPNIGKGRSWFTENDIELATAINTGTSLEPKKVRDIHFFESQLFDTNKRIIDSLIENKKYKNIYSYFNSFHNYFKDFSSSGDVKYWYNISTETIDFVINKINFKESQDNEYVIELADAFSLFHIDICLCFTDYLESTFNIVNNTDWSKLDHKRALSSNINIYNNEQFLNFVEKLENERFIEGRLITPNSFIAEYSNMKLCEYLDTLINTLLSNFKNLDEISKRLLEAKTLKGAALVNSRIVELHNKTLFRINKLISLYDNIKSFEKGNYKYKTINISQKTKDIKELYILSMQQYTKIVVGLYFEKYKIDTEQLDFIGELYYHLSYLMLELIFDNDYSSYEKLYSDFACVCSISSSYIKDIIPPNHNAQYVLNKYTMPTINFMNISGFAIYYSHLIGDDRWEQLVLNYADKIIKTEKEENKGNFVSNCKTCAEITNNSIAGITLLSTNIKSSMENFVRSKGIIKYKTVGYFEQTVIDSKDKLIKNFSLKRRFGFSGELYDVYMIYCINKYLDDNKYISKFKWEEDDK